MEKAEIPEEEKFEGEAPDSDEGEEEEMPDGFEEEEDADDAPGFLLPVRGKTLYNEVIAENLLDKKVLGWKKKNTYNKDGLKFDFWQRPIKGSKKKLQRCDWAIKDITLETYKELVKNVDKLIRDEKKIKVKQFDQLENYENGFPKLFYMLFKISRLSVREALTELYFEDLPDGKWLSLSQACYKPEKFPMKKKPIRIDNYRCVVAWEEDGWLKV